MSIQITHPYVTQVEGVAGGKPVIYDALSFYYDHQSEIDADIEAKREEYVRRTPDR